MAAIYGFNANGESIGSRLGPSMSNEQFQRQSFSSSTGEESNSDDDQNEVRRRESIIQSLARVYSTAYSTHTQPAEAVDELHDPFTAGPDSVLNPQSSKFSALEWAKTIVQKAKEQGVPFRSSGVCFRDLNVYGFGAGTDYQRDVANVWISVAQKARGWISPQSRRIDILRDFNGFVQEGEMLLVLGPPGSGCSTFLKTVAGETNGIFIDDTSSFNYNGMTAKEMHSMHRGELMYAAEVDTHLPQLSVGDTLTFAARARQSGRASTKDTKGIVMHLRDVIMAMFGISHTVNTKVGNDFVRGVSGGERKRVTIAEASLAGSPLGCWDNPTRGLDSANAVEFCKTLRLQVDLFRTTSLVSIYQAPQQAYNLFDKVLVLYDGQEIFFGHVDDAKQYFNNLGFECPARQTTPDFLTSMTSPTERVARQGFEGKVPRSANDFANVWKQSPELKSLRLEMTEYESRHTLDGPDSEAFRSLKHSRQARGQRVTSAYTLSYPQQISLCLWRKWKCLVAEPSLLIGMIVTNAIIAIIVGTLFFNLGQDTASFFQRGSLLYFACLMNALSSSAEVLAVFSQRPVIHKHQRYALVHPSADAIASLICDLPGKIASLTTFNLILYFITNLRREAGAFFFFLLISITVSLTMSMIFRTIGSASKSAFQSLVPTALMVVALNLFTGFSIPKRYMLGWCRWINYLDPLGHAFEAFMVNEFHGRQFDCTDFIPSRLPQYEAVTEQQRVCNSVGALAGQPFVNGDEYLKSTYDYHWENRWRNFGILIAFIVGFFITYTIASEYGPANFSKGEILVYRRGRVPSNCSNPKEDIETGQKISAEREDSSTTIDAVKPEAPIQQTASTFHWEDLCYTVKIKNEKRQILDHVNGWVKPSTMTALMGVSGAGKTTLLDCLADRISTGIITGDMLVNGQRRDPSFQRKTGYVQQQDIHLETTTVREALSFSALLRQPSDTSKAEKLAYVEEVIEMLEMRAYADAVVGVPGDGLNVEQRKRLTIGVELAAKPSLLVFVDEPTSGLDSQTSWAILDLLEKLARAGQAVLCTIHQPSAMLFQRFDRLLFLAKGGRTLYFGDIGQNSDTLTSYFSRNGATPCPSAANPAEWILEVIGAAPGSSAEIDWVQLWKDSPECQKVKSELLELRQQGSTVESVQKVDHAEFSSSFVTQLHFCLTRTFEQYWRTPSYIYSKLALCSCIPLFIGFVFFRASNSVQGLQNQMFAIFTLLSVFGQIVQQSMPQFVAQRTLFEARERPSKTYSWSVFMLSQIVVEIPWNALMAVVMYFCWYYPVGLYRNAAASGTDEVTSRGGLVFLFMLLFMLFTGTFSTLIIAAFETAQAGASLANVAFMMCLLFCGVLASPETLPRFWIFMYRVSPFTYLVGGLLTTATANAQVRCAENEFKVFQPADGQTCSEYMNPYISQFGGYLQDGSNTQDCSFCTVADTNAFLAGLSNHYSERWRNFGILWAYVVFNIGAALLVYWLARVPKSKQKNKQS